LGRFDIPDNAVTSLAYSPDGKTALMGNLSPVVALLDVVNGKMLRQFTGHSLAVMAVAFSPDGKFALTGSLDRTARLWDVATGSEVRQFVGHTDGVHAVAFMPAVTS